MRIFAYESVTGGGFLTGDPACLPPESLRREGEAMIVALAGDLAAIDGFDVFVMRDKRLGRFPSMGASVADVSGQAEERLTFDRLARQAAWTAVIAPELEGALADRCRRVEALGGRLLGPGVEVVELTSDKQRTAEHLAAAGVPVPVGRPIEPGGPLPADFPYPAVLKPRLGAGSEGVRLIAGPDVRVDVPSRLERFWPGVPASVAFLCGPAGHVALPPCRQRLTDDGCFRYLGGSLPLAGPLARRAAQLARRAIETLPEPTGYLGVDLVLGPDLGGGGDVVIEINPRLTTSYVGLRAALGPGGSLAAAMIAARAGYPPELCFRPAEVEFDADGTIREPVA